MTLTEIKKGRLVRRKLKSGKLSKVYEVHEVHEVVVSWWYDRGERHETRKIHHWLQAPTKRRHRDQAARSHDTFQGYPAEDLVLIQRKDPDLIGQIR